MDLDFNQPSASPPATGASTTPPTATKPTAETPASPASVSPAPTELATLPVPSPPSPSPILSEPASLTASETDKPVEEPAPENESEAEEKKSPRLVKWLVIIIIAVVLGGAAYYLFATEGGRSLIGLGSGGSEETLTPTDTGLITDNGGLTNGTNGTTATLAPIASRDSQRKQDLVTVQSYLESYKTAKGSYPETPSFQKISDATSLVGALLVPAYAQTLPVDPLADQGYWYGYKSDSSTYQLTARLEDTSDPAAILDGTIYLYRLDNSSTTSSSSIDLTPATDSTIPSSSSDLTTTETDTQM